MAINSDGILEDNTTTKSRCSSKTSNLSSYRLMKIKFARKDSCCSSKTFDKDIKSPYSTNDKVQILDRVTEKKCINKKPDEIFSSFPLAASVYKANSDEFKLKKKGSKKVKKSVLTLPNEPAPMPNTYTVSDLNDSEGFNVTNDSRANKPKRRRCNKRYKNARVKEHALGFYDRDAHYCSRLNIDLDYSSSEGVNFTGDGNKASGLKYKSNKAANRSDDPQDVWNVLRNINTFQFISSSASQESVVPLRKRRPVIRKKNNLNDTHFIETCHTEEFAYISSYGEAHDTCSPSSSCDRVTVISKKSDQSVTIQRLSQNVFGPKLKLMDKIQSNFNNQMQGKNKLRLKNGSKKILNVKNKKENQVKLLPIYKVHEETPRLEEGIVINCINLHSPEVAEDFDSFDVLKPIEFGHCSDNSSVKQNDHVSNDQTNNLWNADRSPDENKMNNSKSLLKSRNMKVTGLKPIDSEKQLSGITKVILSKGHEIVSSKLMDSQRKPRLSLDLPNAKVSKISPLEIKRRIANQKFPIVILGKDQVTNQGIFISNDDPLQFYGLDNNVWPFMCEWSEERHANSIHESLKKETIKLKNQKGKHKKNQHDEMITRYDHKEVSSNGHKALKEADECKKVKINTTSTNNYSTRLANEATSTVIQKPKPLLLLKNKMFQLLHKNPINYAENDCTDKEIIESIKEHKEVDTRNKISNPDDSNNCCIPITVNSKVVRNVLNKNRAVNKSYSSIQHPWAKGKWASDFIENIIKKIRTGVYYGIDRNENKYRINGTEVSTQTETHTSKNAYCQNGIDYDLKSNHTFKKDDTLKNIPGFDTTFAPLKVETITTNTIAVKHSITNVVVEFDIKMGNDTKNVTHSKESMLCIPIKLKDNKEKIFKCNTSIINAFLPAELCSIIPNMMQTILDVENNAILQPEAVENSQPHLIPKMYYSDPESTVITTNFTKAGSVVSDKLTQILNGKFPKAYAKKNIGPKLFSLTNHEESSIILCQKIYKQILCQFTHSLTNNNVYLQFDTNKQSPESNTNSCKALQLYEPRNHSIIPYLGRLSMADFINKIVFRMNLIESITKINIMHNDRMLNSNIMITRSLLLPRSEDQNILCPSPRGKVGVISLFNAFKKTNQFVSKDIIDVNSLNIFEINSENKEKPCITSDESKTVLRRKPKSHKVARQKSYVKFYRKCNSMSSIANFKSIPLNRVTNLNEFCQVLGSNCFCSILDGCLEKKILGAVEEMKNWTTDLSPKQALLILLLTNKKDTRNLIRFRPVLLQGIAVNRITKAVELDTEIEVIEKENFHKVSQCDGISYLPASTKNQDGLLEELYWIAKTTASDYQKTFDESSENLLKSLLEKRKKLNPSYLRVMARYVGLGLLAPKKFKS